jgi:transglutaminase-like putative cysteine protease
MEAFEVVAVISRRWHLPGWSTLWRRFRNTARTVFTRGDITTLIVTVLLLLVPVLSLNASLSITEALSKQSGPWRIGLNQLIPVAILSVVFGFLLSRSHYSEFMSLILSGIYGVGTIGLVQYLNAPGDPATRVYSIVKRFVGSFNMSSGAGLDPYLLILFLSILIWFLGHNTAWHTFRLDRVWRAILPPGAVLVLNSFYNAEAVDLNGYLAVYVFLALLLIIRSHIEAREFDWYMNRVAFQRNLRAWFFRAGAIVGIVLLALAWVLPTGSAEENAKRYSDFLNGNIINQLNSLLNRLFSSVEGQGMATADYYGGDVLTLGGAIDLGDQVVMVVKAPPGPRYYWKSRVFDIYSTNKWSSPRGLQISTEKAGLQLRYPPTDPTARQDVEQRFTMVLGASRLVYAAPQPVTLGLPVQVDMDYVDAAQKTINPSVIRPLNTLEAGEEYSVLSSISVASAPFLRSVPTTYPDYAKALDLQVPSNVTNRTRALAQQIVQQAGAKTNYDKAKAVERWLRKNIKYNEALPNPPNNEELVDWVLFTQKEGYCTYYASAMIVMLRTLGIPTRMAAGFAQGTYDSTTQTYVVRERDAHTWVEVFFPEAGWVEFEPTSAQQSLDRPDANGPQPSVTPSPTPSPSPTPLPSPTPTSTQAGPNAAGQLSPQPQFTFTPSPEPTSVPSPTPAPLPPPKLLEVPPPVRNALTFVLLLIGVIAVLSFMAVGFLWWVEYRGLDRLSAVGRAYARLAIYARWLGIPLSAANTPLERGRRIMREVPTGSRPVTSITDMYIDERYGRPRASTPTEEKNAQSAWRNARREFVARKLRRWLRRE